MLNVLTIPYEFVFSKGKKTYTNEQNKIEGKIRYVLCREKKGAWLRLNVFQIYLFNFIS